MTIVQRLRCVAGVQAVVLGGSRARGTHTAASDIDLGIYYYPAAALDLSALAAVAVDIDDEHRVVNEKGAVALAASFPRRAELFKQRVASAFG